MTYGIVLAVAWTVQIGDTTTNRYTLSRSAAERFFITFPAPSASIGGNTFTHLLFTFGILTIAVCVDQARTVRNALASGAAKGVIIAPITFRLRVSICI